jgi:hypothetical protein
MGRDASGDVVAGFGAAASAVGVADAAGTGVAACACGGIDAIGAAIVVDSVASFAVFADVTVFPESFVPGFASPRTAHCAVFSSIARRVALMLSGAGGGPAGGVGRGGGGVSLVTGKRLAEPAAAVIERKGADDASGEGATAAIRSADER